MRKCIIFGASKTGVKAYELLKDKYDICFFSDNSTKKIGGKICGKEIISPSVINKYSEYVVIIASVYYSAINKQLLELGVKNILIFYCFGNLSESNENLKYGLYEMGDEILFEKCKYDYELVSKITSDFSLNYKNESNTVKCNEVSKKEKSKNVLICAYIFPPLGSGGVQRTLKFAKYLKKNGYFPCILTVGKNDNKYGLDTTLLDDVNEGIEIIRVDDKIIFPELLSLEEQQEIFNLYAGVVEDEDWLKEYKNIFKEKNIDCRLIPDNKIGWVNECLKIIESKINLNEYGVVFTTGTPFSSFLLGYYIKHKYNIKWVMDYRDSWTSNDYYIEHVYKNDVKLTLDIQRTLESKLVDYADAVIVVAKNLIYDYKDKFGCSLSKFVEITNGYDESDFDNIYVSKNDSDKYTICYNGSLGFDRDSTVLLKVINGLIKKGKIDSGKIRWIFNGLVLEEDKRKLNEIDNYNIIEYNGYLPHKESLISAMNTDLLVLYGFKDEGAKFGYNGKVFEYIRMQTPIIAFASKGGVLDEILNETNTGSVFEYDDYQGIEEYLLTLYRAWEQKKEIYFPNIKNIKKYSREETTLSLMQVFKKLFE